MHYTVNSRGKHQFEITDERQVTIGYMDYSPWSPAKTNIATRDNNMYKLTPTGFWRTTLAITKNGLPYGELKHKLTKGLLMSFENGLTFVFKKKDLWGMKEYVLVDSSENEIAIIKSYFKWSIFTFTYEIDIFPNNFSTETNNFLPLILLYCSRLIRLRNASMYYG